MTRPDGVSIDDTTLTIDAGPNIETNSCTLSKRRISLNIGASIAIFPLLFVNLEVEDDDDDDDDDIFVVVVVVDDDDDDDDDNDDGEEDSVFVIFAWFSVVC